LRSHLRCGVGGEPDRWARLLDGLRLEREFAQSIEASLVAHAVLGPEPPEDRDPLLEPGPALDQLHVERGKLRLCLLARKAPADAGGEKHPAGRDVLEGRPLSGEEDGIPQRKRRQAAGTEPDAPGASGDRREEHERFEPGLGEEAVTNPDGVEHAGGFRLLGDRQQLVDARGAEQHAPVWQAQPVAGPLLHVYDTSSARPRNCRTRSIVSSFGYIPFSTRARDTGSLAKIPSSRTCRPP